MERGDQATMNRWATEDELRAWRNQGHEAASLYQQAAVLEGKFRWVGLGVGLWIGAAAGWRLIRWGRQTRRRDYDADPAGCLACGRCFSSCPVEWERKGLVMPTLEGKAV